MRRRDGSFQADRRAEKAIYRTEPHSSRMCVMSLAESGSLTSWIGESTNLNVLAHTGGKGYVFDVIFGNRVLRSDHTAAHFSCGFRSGYEVFLFGAKRGTGSVKAQNRGAVLWGQDNGMGLDDHKCSHDSGCRHRFNLGWIQKRILLLGLLSAVYVDFYDLQTL